MSASSLPPSRKKLIVPTQEQWAAAFSRINTPELRKMARDQLRRQHYQANAGLYVDILFPDIARTLAVRPDISDVDVRKFIRGAIARAVSNETQRGKEAKIRKRELSPEVYPKLVSFVLAKRGNEHLRARHVLEEERDIVAHASSKLNQRQKQMLKLAFDGKTPHDMARELGISFPTAQTAWYRVVAHLKDVAKKERSFHVRKPIPKKKSISTSRRPKAL